MITPCSLARIIAHFELKSRNYFKTPEHAIRKARQSGWIRYWYSPEIKTWGKIEVEKSSDWFIP
jgi:hypothetical protein